MLSIRRCYYHALFWETGWSNYVHEIAWSFVKFHIPTGFSIITTLANGTRKQGFPQGYHQAMTDNQCDLFRLPFIVQHSVVPQQPNVQWLVEAMHNKTEIPFARR